jgi:uncharacterized protein (TIGR03086 family)
VIDDRVVRRAVIGDLSTVHAAAIEGFASRVGQVGDGDWGRPTPCAEWDVRALVNHVVGANVRYQMLLQGAPLDEVEATRTIDYLGGAPLESFETTAAAVVRAFADPDVLDRTFHHVTGTRTGRQLLVMRTYDIGVHTWDLAVAISADRRIEDAVVAVALTATVPAANESHDLSEQDRLLHRAGRRQDTKEYR